MRGSAIALSWNALQTRQATCRIIKSLQSGLPRYITRFDALRHHTRSHLSGLIRNSKQVCASSIFFWNVLMQNVFLRPFGRFTVKTMAYSIMVVRQILVLFVLVRIQVGQPSGTSRFFSRLSRFYFRQNLKPSLMEIPLVRKTLEL